MTLLVGCAGGSGAIVDTLRFGAGLEGRAPAQRFDPNYSYLRLSTDGGVAFLALGNVDATASGPVEVWYSTRREVLRLANGRLAGVVGATTEWRNVSIPPLPSWAEIARAGELRWTRERDVMPGYRFDVKDALAVRVIEPPGRSALQRIDPASLTWFEEAMVENSSSTQREYLPPARYAVSLGSGGEELVYAEQCLSVRFCLAWQRWPAALQGPGDKK